MEAEPAPPPRPINPGHKYDRQIRIWGHHGQATLERASVCLVNATATGTEILKNLVLPAIGSFTVIDGADITDADRANNFFLTSPHTLKPRNRALVTVEAMRRLNHHVVGSHIPHHVSSFINSDATACAFFRRFSVVVVSQMGIGHPVVNHIAAGCYRANVPLLVVRSYGLLGYVRIQARELSIYDTKQDDLAPDLRLCRLFPALEQYVASIDLNLISDTTALSHVPFVIILAKAVHKFRTTHAGNLPNSRSEKEQFIAIVKSLRPPSCPHHAENFDEAERPSNLRLCYANAADISPHTRQLLTDPRSDPNQPQRFHKTDSSTTTERFSFPETIRIGKRASRVSQDQQPRETVPGIAATDRLLQGAAQINNDNAAFWVHAAGIRRFFEKHTCLPLRGSLPDMTADTESYVHLQNIYSNKAAADALEVLAYAQEVAERYRVDVEVDEKSVKTFCRTVHGMRSYSTRSIHDEMEKPGEGEYREAAMSEGALDASENGFASPYYVSLRAADEFYREHGRHAGGDAAAKENDAGLMHEYVTKLKEDLGISAGSSLWRDYAEEVVRYANVEMHNIAAFMGGVAAQEVTKILTHQFVPFNNTLLVNFAEQTSVTFAA